MEGDGQQGHGGQQSDDGDQEDGGRLHPGADQEGKRGLRGLVPPDGHCLECHLDLSHFLFEGQ